MNNSLESGCLALVVSGHSKGITVLVGKYIGNIPEITDPDLWGVTPEIFFKDNWGIGRKLFPFAPALVLQRLDKYQPSIEELKEQTIDIASEMTGVMQ